MSKPNKRHGPSTQRKLDLLTRARFRAGWKLCLHTDSNGRDCRRQCPPGHSACNRHVRYLGESRARVKGATVVRQMTPAELERMQ